MTQTASNPLGPRLSVSVPEPGSAVQGFAAAAGLAGPLAAGPLVPELESHLGPAAAVVQEEGDVLSEVWRTSSHLESMQWELDNALESLRQAVRRASAAGVAHDELCTAGNLTPDELSAVLVPAAGGPAGVQV
ncbi:hypothetical protein [Arthrobacter sp. B1I2]|uniref:hypothetical protein n=1 Tax=Arthrobacter sp. B1I2 TaxID=3042263 RepID=UPI002789FE36|nr:hypothetical protein [Arthrobacter sp. B1I2]MDQ0729905.1 hypothetical protein [Arthrobacter sp. B1I2]